MGSRGLEPPTSRLSGVRSNHLSYEPVSDPPCISASPSHSPRQRFFKPLTHAGGDNRDRTDDPLLAKQVLSQLSYTPVVICFGFPILLFLRTSKIKQRL